jgi:CBS domain-containing protein
MYSGTVSTREVSTCIASATILEVAQQMRRDHVGDLVVVEYRSGEPIPIGIVTDRDLVVGVMAKDIDASKITAGDIMGPKIVTAYEGEQLEVAMERMRWSGVRRIPLVDSAGVLVGIVSLDDIEEKLAQTLANISCVGRTQKNGEKILRE